MNTEIEIWKDVPGYEGMYQCSTSGRVKSLSRFKKNHSKKQYIPERILALNKSDDYYVITLSNNLVKKTFRVHQLVAITFLNHKPNGHKTEIDHIDNNKLFATNSIFNSI